MTSQPPEIDFEAELAELEELQQEGDPASQAKEEQPAEAEAAAEPMVEDKTQKEPADEMTEEPATESDLAPVEASDAAAEAEPPAEAEAAETEQPAEAEPEPEAPAPNKSAPAAKPLVGCKAGFAALKKNTSAAPAPAANPSTASAPAKAAPPAAAKKPALVGPKKIIKSKVVVEGEDEPKKAPAKKKAPLLMGKAKPGDAAGAAAPAAPTGPEVAPANSAYIHFCTVMRPKMKAENPSLSLGDMAKLMGQAFKALSAEERTVYDALAAMDKARVQRELAAGGVLRKSNAKAKKEAEQPKKKASGGGGGGGAAKRPRAPRSKTPFELFCEESHAAIKEANPKASAAELKKLLTQAWAELDGDEQKPFQDRSKELKAEATAAAAAAAATAPSDDEASDYEGERTPKRPRPRAARPTSYADDGDEAMPEAGDGSDDDDDDRENVDWEAHPAAFILSRSRTKYVVARRGLPLHEYGEVPVVAAHAQARGGEAPPPGTAPCPLTAAHLDEYDAFLKAFRREMFDNTEGSELVLEELRPGSLLEACALLGALREPGEELAGVDRRADVWMKVPAIATSRLVQRMLMVERARVAELEAELAALKAAAGVPAGKEAAPAAEAAVAEA